MYDMHRNRPICSLLVIAVLGAGGSAAAAAADDARALNELRNTVVNMLQGLVERGVLTREQAEKMVADAQNKAQADAAARAAQEQAEAGAVRVPYVPKIVKDEIRREVVTDLGEQVARNVIETAQSEGWGVPAALPDWVRRMRWYGDLRVRGQGDIFASDNTPNSYLDFQRVNAAGGIGKAGLSALVNTSEDRNRARMRLRLGFEATLGYGWTMGARLTSGALNDPISTNQTLGNTGFRYQLGIDMAYLDWTGNSDTGRHTLQFSAGRLRSPWFTASDLVYDQDLMFDGAAVNYRLGLVRDDPYSHFVYATVGAFPLQEVELARDKYMLGGQLGVDYKFASGSRLRAGAAYYDFRNIAGRRNTFESNLLDYTAPQYLRQGNTLFSIRNDNDSTTDLFALAADYRLVNYSMAYDWRVASSYRVSIAGDYVQNLGYDVGKVLARTGSAVERRNVGYQGEIGFGSASMAQANAWRVVVGYRRVERDAVLDAFTDSDFRLGGTDAKGYTFGFDYSFTPKVMTRVRYLSGNEIDGPPLGIDVVQLDLNASF
jgi:polyhydroxyalkanoate synthesis regulator phasin